MNAFSCLVAAAATARPEVALSAPGIAELGMQLRLLGGSRRWWRRGGPRNGEEWDDQAKKGEGEKPGKDSEGLNQGCLGFVQPNTLFIFSLLTTLPILFRAIRHSCWSYACYIWVVHLATISFKTLIFPIRFPPESSPQKITSQVCLW